MGKIFLQSFNDCLAFPRKWFCIRGANSEFLSFVLIFNNSDDLIGTFQRELQ